MPRRSTSSPTAPSPTPTRSATPASPSPSSWRRACSRGRRSAHPPRGRRRRRPLGRRDRGAGDDRRAGCRDRHAPRRSPRARDGRGRRSGEHRHERGRRRRRGRRPRQGQEHGLSPANYNGGGQLVVAGALDALAAFAAEPRAVPGSFRCRSPERSTPSYMAPARDAAAAGGRRARDDHDVSTPRVTLWTNRDGTTVSSGARALELLVGPGRVTGSLGPLHGVVRRARGDRRHRTRTRRGT